MKVPDDNRALAWLNGRGATPGGALLHPVALGALLTLALNDHFLKHVCPGAMTGKLSDFAGVVLLPLFMHALLELWFARILRKPLGGIASERWLVACIVVSLLAFALPEVWKPAELVYRYGLGAARWPFRALAALLSGNAAPELGAVRATADVTDLLATPFAYVAFSVGKLRPARPRRARITMPSHEQSGDRSPQASAVSHST